MTTLFNFLAKGGPVMLPIVGLSVVTLTYALDRGVSWYRSLRHKNKVAPEILNAARYDLREAERVAEQRQDSGIGRVLVTPLRLPNPSPEAFHLALKTSEDQELAAMRKGDRWLEPVIPLALLLGLLGTVVTLIITFLKVNVTDGQKIDLSQAANSLANALIPSAAGIIVAIFALAVHRISINLQNRQSVYFSRVGSELELIHRQVWYEPQQAALTYSATDASASQQ